MSLPKSLSFPNVKSSSVASVSSVYMCSPTSGAAAVLPSSIISFDIPAGIRSQWLDCAMTIFKFTVQVTLTAGTTPGWQALPMDFIRSVNLYSSAGSKNIENLEVYSNAHTLLRDVYSDSPNCRTSDSIMLNLDPTKLRSSVAQASGTQVTYALPLASLIGLTSAADVMLPLHALNAPLRLEIGLTVLLKHSRVLELRRQSHTRLFSPVSALASLQSQIQRCNRSVI